MLLHAWVLTRIDFAAIRKGSKDVGRFCCYMQRLQERWMIVLLYARVLTILFDLASICKGFKHVGRFLWYMLRFY